MSPSKCPVAISELICLYQSSLYPKISQLKFSSHLSVGLPFGERYSWLIFFSSLCLLPTAQFYSRTEQGGRRGKVAGKDLPDHHVSLALYSENSVQYFIIYFGKENDLGIEDEKQRNKSRSYFHNL